MSSPEHPWLLPAALAAEPDDAAPLRRSARDWLVDSLAFLFAITVAAILTGVMLSAKPAYPDLVVVLDLALGWLSTPLVWLRRRWPVGLAVAMAAVGCVSVVSSGVGIVALFTVAVHRRLSVAATVAGLAVVANVVIYAWRPDPNSTFLGDLVAAGLIVAVILAWGLFVRARRQLVLSLKDRAHRAESEQHLRVEQARQLERTRIAREMHDVLAHRISLLSLHAGALEFRPDAPPADVAQAAAVIRASAHQALQDLREVISVLRDTPSGNGAGTEPPQPTLVDLAALVDESRAAGARIRFENTVEDPAAVPPNSGRNAYRIVQEGLTNVRKHAPGAVVDVVVAGAAGDGVTVEVRNPWPVGGTPATIPGTGTGLVGLTERAQLAGGRLEHGRTDSGDFRLWAWLPWPS